MAPMLILDFDETLVDKDSGEWVAEQLGAASLFHDLRWGQGMPFHQAMNAVLHTLHSQGTTIAHIRHALSRLPLPSESVATLKAAHSLGCELHILSDANTFFIESVLAHHGLDSLFTCIHSNPAWINAKGCLYYSDFHGDMLPPHNCPLCPPNMCKGSILDTIRATNYDPAALQIIYAGDGIGDLCPSLRLSKQDYVLPRQGYPLSLLLEQQQVKARLRPWNSLAATLNETLLEFVKCSGHVNEPRASSSDVSSLLHQVDNDTFCRGSTIASRSGFHTGSHDVCKANSSLWRDPFSNCLITKSLRAHDINGLHRNVMATMTRTACLWRSSKRLSCCIQTSAPLVPLVSGTGCLSLSKRLCLIWEALNRLLSCHDMLHCYACF